SGGTLTIDDAALDLSGMTVSSRIESSYAGGTIFTVADVAAAFHVYGGGGNDTLIASGFTLSANQRDSIFLNSSIEAVRDNSGLYGNDQSNVLYAIANDTITGQGGSDTFVFSAGFASAVITDFTPGTDIIRIPGELFATSQILDYATQQNADVVFDALTGDTLRLYNVNLASLSLGDFDLI
ncbi:M10 family metallopeptidase C-terminal domain-containing protein, partial [Mesorhizobium norvegicum]|uniref:M10 family metallopeptidase C-terminal domain-containing protein n=1 Tax=Mesorhizobium norvegicum TaxID=1085774 RepID=UPI003CCC5428